MKFLLLLALLCGIVDQKCPGLCEGGGHFYEEGPGYVYNLSGGSSYPGTPEFSYWVDLGVEEEGQYILKWQSGSVGNGGVTVTLDGGSPYVHTMVDHTGGPWWMLGTAYASPSDPIHFEYVATTSSRDVYPWYSSIGVSKIWWEKKLLGDYNTDGFVDSADYTVWRDATVLPDDPLIGWEEWKDNFGNMNAFHQQVISAVPETGLGLLIVSYLVGLFARVRRLTVASVGSGVVIFCLLCSSSWAAYPTIVFNNSTGSDSVSGTGPASSISGTNASYTASVFTLDGSPDLSGVSDSGTVVIYVNTTSGPKFFSIIGVDDTADTVTVTGTPAGTATGLSWVIGGGDRATINDTDSRNVFTDSLLDGWTVELEYTGTNYTLSTTGLTLNYGAGATYNIRGSGSGRVVIEQTSNASTFLSESGASPCYCQLGPNLKLINSAGTPKTSAIGYNRGGQPLSPTCYDVIFGDSTNKLYQAVSLSGSAFGGCRLRDCVIQHCLDVGINCSNSGTFYQAVNCAFLNNASHGVNAFGNMDGPIVNCVFAYNGGNGVRNRPDGATSAGTVASCLFVGNTLDGYDIENNNGSRLQFKNCVFMSNTYGVDNNSTLSVSYGPRLEDCYFYNNASGRVDGGVVQINSVDLSGDPFVSASTGNYNLDSTTGEGATLRAANILMNGSSTKGYPFRYWVADDWGAPIFPSGWSHRITHSVTTEPGSNLTDFTFLISLNQMPTEFWQNVKAGGADIRATKDAEGTQQLPVDPIRVVDNGTTGEGVIAVKWTGTKSSSANEPIYIWVGCPEATLPAVDSTFGQYAAYNSNIRGFWPDGGSEDRTSYQLDLTPSTTAFAGGADGFVNGVKATDYNGSSQYHSAATPVTAAPLTILAQFNTDTLASLTYPEVAGISDTGSANASFALRPANSGSGGQLDAAAWNSPTAGTSSTAAGTVSTATWYHAGGLFTSSTSRTAYLNGSAATANTTSVTPAGLDDFTIGAWKTNSPTRFFDGKISLVSLHNVALSGDWISYHKEMLDDADQSDFYGTWSATATSGLGGGTPTYTRSRVVNQ